MINQNELEIGSGIAGMQPMGPGGQHAGVPLGVSLRHAPTGLVAFCATERSQLKNKQVAEAMLEAGLAYLSAKWTMPEAIKQ